MAVYFLLLQLCLVVIAVQLAGPGRSRQLASAVPVAIALVLPLFAPGGPLMRAALAYFGLMLLLKVVHLDRSQEQWSWRQRLWHGFAPFDVHATTRVSPAADGVLLVSIIVHACLALAAWHALSAGFSPAHWSLPLRLLLGAALVYCAMDVATESIRFVHRLFGIDVPPIQRMPILSQTVSEFWGGRWNRPVSGWLNEYFFMPFARRRQLVKGTVAAFTASAFAHAWLFHVVVGLRGALMWGGFFLLHGAIVLVETRLRVRRWPRALRHAWTMGLLLLTSPLFVLPVLEAIGL